MADGCHVVTGASSGIGACVARRLLDRGENVLLVARDPGRLAEVGAGRANAVALPLDLDSRDAAQRVAAAVKGGFGRVRGFVHAAGFTALAPLSLLDAAAAASMWNVHAYFPMAFMGWLAKAPNHTEGASCVLVSSSVCHEGDAGNAAYAASKGAVEGMLRSAAAELAARGVRVNAVAPGVVDTPLAHRAWMDDADPATLERIRGRYPFGFGTPEKVADVIDFFLSPASAWVTGQCLIADGGRSFS